MNSERKDWLINQYVWPIQNNRSWHDGSSKYLSVLETRGFQRFTSNFI